MTTRIENTPGRTINAARMTVDHEARQRLIDRLRRLQEANPSRSLQQIKDGAAQVIDAGQRLLNK